MDLHLKDKKVIVVGGARGIGLVTAHQFASEGCAVAICARTQTQVAEAVTALKAHGGTVVGGTADAASGAAYKAWLETAIAELGGVDILVTMQSAGGGVESEQNWYNNFETDLMGSVRAAETVIPHMTKAGQGSIVFIASTAAVETFAAPQSFNALKASVLTYSAQLSQAVAASGIRVNVVSPGPIYFDGGAWEFIKNNMAEFYQMSLAGQPSGRMGTPQEVANAVAFIASPAASWITGENLIVDGGFTKRVAF